jgi:anaerobic selenocysteine-containing dehydrogenase/Fe-S-cluster-containing dehydrogenase component
MSRLAMIVDLERCIGCKSCEAACKQEHGLGPGEFRNKVIWLGDAGHAAGGFLPVACQHCDRPACLRACTVYPAAISKDEATGVVQIDASRCTGCGECVVACPYGAMGYDAVGHHAVKCDLCADRRAEDRLPACVEVCPGYALDIGERHDLVIQAVKQGRSILDHDHYLLNPATLYVEPLPRLEGRDGQASGVRAGDPEAVAAALRLAEPPAVMGTGVVPGTATGILRGAARPLKATFPYRVPRPERQAEHTVAGGCNICFNCCPVNFHFRGDRLVNITGNPDDPLFKGKVCPKSQMTLQLYHNQERLMTPLKRVGARGQGRFEPISWEQALTEIAEKMTRVKDAWGPEALGLFVGTRTGLLVTRGYARLFAQLWGTPNVVGTDPFCATGKSIAYELTQGQVGSGNSYTRDDLGSAELYVFFGDNQAETRPVYFGMINDWRLRNQAKMVVVDPRRSVTADKADRWLAIRPGTDMALGLAIAYHILAQGLHDRRFCEAWVLGWEHWRDFIFAQDYSPEWAAPITDVPCSEICRLAEEIARADGCVIFASRGVNQHSNSTQTNRVLMFVAAITGNWGRPGGAYVNMTPGLPITAQAPAERTVEPAKPKIRHSPSGWTEAMRDCKPYPLKAMIACNNPMSNWPGQQAAREAFAALELLVHIELFANETSAFADYVLPAATGIEQGDVGRASDDRRVVWIDKMIDPPGEAKADGWIWVELGKRFGFEDVLQDAYADPAVFWDEVLIQNEAMRGCTQRRLHSVPHRWVRMPVSSEAAPEQETLYLEGSTALGAPEGHRFPTPSGKLEFFTAALEEKFQALGLSALPEFYSEREQLVDLPYIEFEVGDEQPGVCSPFHKNATWASRARLVTPGTGTAGAGSATADTPGARLRRCGFDTELVTGRPPAPHFHSWTHYFWQAQEMWPDLHVHLHPERAVALGIADGDRVRIVSAHGAIEARAWLNAGIRPTAVFIPLGWGERQPFHPWRSVNFLTDKAQRDPISDQTNLKTLLCRVEKL